MRGIVRVKFADWENNVNDPRRELNQHLWIWGPVPSLPGCCVSTKAFFLSRFLLLLWHICQSLNKEYASNQRFDIGALLNNDKSTNLSYFPKTRLESELFTTLKNTFKSKNQTFSTLDHLRVKIMTMTSCWKRFVFNFQFWNLRKIYVQLETLEQMQANWASSINAFKIQS